MTMNHYVAQLIAYAEKYLDLVQRDKVYVRNRLMDILGVYDYEDQTVEKIPNLPDEILQGIFAILDKEGESYDKSTLGEKLMDAVMLTPSAFEDKYYALYKQSPSKATEWANAYAIHSDYVKKSAIDKNIKFNADNGLEITINLSKPEKNNKDLQKQLTVKSTSYPKCTICRENEGYQKQGFSRRNMRTVSLKLNEKDWFWQYSPYAYFNEHGIVISVEHTPMVLNEDTVKCLLDFVEQYPHYFVGNNAPLPRVGGSILMHNHFQGGKTVLPMQKSGYRSIFNHNDYKNVAFGTLDWYNTALRIESTDREQITKMAMAICNAWENYDNPSLDIVSHTGTERHNTASCIARKTENGYILDMILRNNRVDDRYPDGIFHAHREYHHIKSESIGLIEAMGLFILPARLKRQFSTVRDFLTGKTTYIKENLTDDMLIFVPMIERMLKENDVVSQEKAEEILKKELENVCQNILYNTAVFKNDDAGVKALNEFLSSIGFELSK